MTLDSVFNQIVDEFTEDRIPGWCPVEKAMDLAATVIALRPKVVLEVGVFGGKSLIPMALACQAIDSGVCIGIDPWSAQASAEGYDGENRNWWEALNHDAILQGFVANVARLGLTDRIAIERAKSDDATAPKSICVLHVDGQHSEQAVRDVRKYASLVRVGGIACLDDIEWENGGDKPVHRAIDAIKALGFIELYRRIQPNGNWAMFQRTSLPASVPISHAKPGKQTVRTLAISRVEKARK